MQKTFHTSNTFTTQWPKLNEVATIKLQESSELLPLAESPAEREVLFEGRRQLCNQKPERKAFQYYIMWIRSYGTYKILHCHMERQMCVLLEILKTGSLLLRVRGQNELLELMTEKIMGQGRDRDRKHQKGTFSVPSGALLGKCQK